MKLVFNAKLLVSFKRFFIISHIGGIGTSVGLCSLSTFLVMYIIKIFIR